MTFEVSEPIDGEVECAPVTIVDDDVFEGFEQDFTVSIVSDEIMYFGILAADNVKCVNDCEAEVIIQDNNLDCKFANVCECVSV